MKKVVSVWLDHQEAVMVLVTDAGRDTRRIKSYLETDSHFSDKSQGAVPEDAHDRRFPLHLNQYYDKVIADIRGAGFIFIYGQGDAPTELSLRMEAADMGGRIMLVETADKMTDSQLGGRAQQRYQALNA